MGIGHVYLPRLDAKHALLRVLELFIRENAARATVSEPFKFCTRCDRVSRGWLLDAILSRCAWWGDERWIDLVAGRPIRR
jgi:hypothetical protein